MANLHPHPALPISAFVASRAKVAGGRVGEGDLNGQDLILTPFDPSHKGKGVYFQFRRLLKFREIPP
jgi:hypothetical protein